MSDAIHQIGMIIIMRDKVIFVIMDVNYRLIILCQ